MPSLRMLTALGALLLPLPACAPATGAAGRAVAERTLKCAGDDLRFDALGELVVRPGAPIALDLYSASGCSAQTEIYCRRDGGARCALSVDGLVGEAEAPAVARALHLRRTASRARCAPETLRVVQESESLWRFEACDGVWGYHCRWSGCEVLGRR